MLNGSISKIEYLWFKYSKLIIALFLMLIILVLFLLFKESYSKREEPFDEITKQLNDIYDKDKDLKNKYKTLIVEQKTKGIDVSSWQGDIDWDKVAEENLDFVMIRCGFRNLTNESIEEDKNFRYNIENATRVGIPVGIYFYSTAISELEVIEEASFILNLIKNYQITYPIAYDYELFNQKRTINTTDETVNDNALKFINYIEEHGYNTLLYTNSVNLNYHWFENTINNTNLWFAKYASNPGIEFPYTMWQYADNGRINGIKGYVDLNESTYLYTIERG